jgi:hypothetical protein
MFCSISIVQNHATSVIVANQLPPEILRIIFNYAMPSSASLERFVINGPNSACSEEYQIKRFLVAVCRHWWHVGMELLYGNIIIRSVENFAAFHRTLVAPGSCAGRLVRKMMISCVVPFGDHLMMFEECMKRIIVHCPLIASLAVDLSFRPSSVDTRPWHPPYQNLGLLLRTMHVSDVTLNITYLHWGCCLQLRDLVSMLQHCSKLKRLQFYPHTQDELERYDVEDYPDDTLVVLPNLQELHFGYSDCISSSPTFCAES